MSKKSKGSLVLAALLFLGSTPTWASSVEGRPNFADSSAAIAFADAVSGWLASVLLEGRSMVTSIWDEYGIAIDPNGVPSDPAHATTTNSTANPTGPNAL